MAMWRLGTHLVNASLEYSLRVAPAGTLGMNRSSPEEPSNTFHQLPSRKHELPTSVTLRIRCAVSGWDVRIPLKIIP